MGSDLRLFVSHSGQDADIAERLIQLIQNALNLPASAIRCTSVDGYRLPGGANTDERLRAETLEADAFIGLISEHSIGSMYVAFELGARWGANKHLMPILAPGVGVDVLGGPLAGLNALRSDSRSQLHQIVDDLAGHLGISPASPAAYQRYVEPVLELPRCDPTASNSSGSVVKRPFSSFLKQITMFSSESNKLQYISDNGDRLPEEISFGEFVMLLDQFAAESNKLSSPLKYSLGCLFWQ